jgi:hypothetical protein
MKKLLSLLSFILLFVSCEKDESLIPLPVVNNGLFVKLDVKNKQLDFNNLSTTSFGGTLTAPSANVDHYDLYIRRKNSASLITGEYVKILTVTAFPYELSITPSLIAQTLNIDVSQLENGDVYDFNAFSFDKDGKRAGYGNIPRITQTEFTLEQGFRFNTSLASPLDPFYNNRTLN